MRIKEKDWSGFLHFAHIRVPKDAIEFDHFMVEHKLTMKKGRDYHTGIKNMKHVPEIFDTLRHECGLIVKVRDYEYIPYDNKYYWIVVTNNNPNTDKAIFQECFHDYMDAVQAERAALNAANRKRGRKPLPEYKEYMRITSIQIFKKD
jgi:hypothetical protein